MKLSDVFAVIETHCPLCGARRVIFVRKSAITSGQDLLPDPQHALCVRCAMLKPTP